MALLTPREALASLLSYGANALHEAAARLRPERRILVLGGARSGKSRHAERLLERYPEVTYIATGASPAEDDPEWAERVRLHRERRPSHWHTVETGDLATTLREARTPVLIDCIGTWLARVLDEAGAWDDADGWRDRVEERVCEMLDALRDTDTVVVAVSNEVGSGVVPATPAGRLFRDVLGSLNRRVAEASDSVLLVVAGRVLKLRQEGVP